MKTDDQFIQEYEIKLNENKKWYNRKITFSDRDKLLIKLGYRQAIKEMNDFLRSDTI